MLVQRYPQRCWKFWRATDKAASLSCSLGGFGSVAMPAGDLFE
jgi:hypothetical protein